MMDRRNKVKPHLAVLFSLMAAALSACEGERSVSGNIPEENPHEITAAFVETGKQRFERSCALCHGKPGTGDGIAVQALKKLPPSYHTKKLRQASDGYLFNIITNGTGTMPAFGSTFSEEERWAIVAYIRDLQARTS